MILIISAFPLEWKQQDPLKIFISLKEKHELYYIYFYGDGASKQHPAVKDRYGPTKPIKKFECVDHYQKRVGSWFPNLKNKNTKVLGLLVLLYFLI